MATPQLTSAVRALSHRALSFSAIAVPCLVLAAITNGAEPRTRPHVPPGGNNWIPPVRQSARAITTQDLNSGLTPTDLVNALLGGGVAVSNVHFVGDPHAAGTFAGAGPIIGVDGGIILSSGDIAFVPGPNTQDDVTADNAMPGDLDLDGLVPGYETFDACFLEFDFDFECAGTQTILFQYVFTSDEYNEWVNSPYNDVFGFFLNGQNIAQVPGSNGLAASINNVNCDNPHNPPAGSFCNLYINNDCDDIPPGTYPCDGVRDIQMDGLLVVLTATGTLQPGVNHIKLAVADAGDHILDSNVFIRGQSFTCGTPTGACCHTIAQTCDDNVAEANCQAPGDVWSVGLACSQLDPPCVQTQPGEGEDCQHTILIPALPYTNVNTTCGMDNDYSNSCIDPYDNGDDILYELRLTSAVTIDIRVTGATPNDNWIGIAVAETCPPGGTCVASATTSGTVATINSLTLSAGIYYLMIDRWPAGEECMNFTLSINTGDPTGACCHTLTQTCDENVLEAECHGAGDVWTAAAACSQLVPPCLPATDDGRDCEFPIVVTSLPYTNVNSTCGMHEDYSATCLGVYDDGDDILYELHLATSRTINIEVTGATANDDLIGVVIGESCPPGLKCLAMATTDGTVAAIPDLSLAAGVYYLMIDRWPLNADCMDFTLRITIAGGLIGDMNCDGFVTVGDIAGFVLALTNPAQYAITYPGCNINNADINGNGAITVGDIGPFVLLLAGG